MVDIRKHVGERVKHYRERAGLSQRKLAKDAGVDPSTVFRLEKGEAWPEYDNVSAIAGILGVEEHLLLLTPNKVEDLYRDLLAILATLNETQLRAVLAVARAAANGDNVKSAVDPGK